MHTEIAPGVLQIDTLLGGWHQVTAGYLVTGDAPVLVETGSQTSVPHLLAALAELGVDPGELAGVAVTHIHLDHAGGVGDVAAAFPEATIYVHERGARHLVDPTRLVSSAAMVYGDLLDSLYGRLTPTPAERVKVLHDGDEVVVSSNRTLTAVDSPGHAKHHLALHDSDSGQLVAGDAVGVRCPTSACCAQPPRRPTSTSTALRSLRRFADRRPAGIALAHFGLVPDLEAILEEARDARAVGRGGRERPGRAGRGGAGGAVRHDLDGVDPDRQEKLETLNGIHPTRARRWLEQGNRVRAGARQGGPTATAVGTRAGGAGDVGSDRPVT